MNNLKPFAALAALVALAILGKIEATAVVTFIGGLFMTVAPKADS